MMKLDLHPSASQVQILQVQCQCSGTMATTVIALKFQYVFFSAVAQQPVVGLGFLTVEVSKSQSITQHNL
jgi:hypothetical protein